MLENFFLYNLAFSFSIPSASKYFNKALSPSDVYGIYRSGYKAISLYDKIAGLKPNIKLNLSVSASVNDHEVSAAGKLG